MYIASSNNVQQQSLQLSELPPWADLGMKNGKISWRRLSPPRTAPLSACTLGGMTGK